MQTLSLADVTRVRARIARAHELAAIQFRDAFVPGETSPTLHLQLLTDALIGEAEGIRLTGPAYEIANDLITPLYANFEIERIPVTIFEYWRIVSEITGSDAWRMTKLIVTADEYDAALQQMRSPQIVRALVPSFLPAVDDSMLSVTVYTRAGEERIERRVLHLDERNEFHFHSRDLIAEGR